MKSAVVTGASSGIGREFAILLAEDGYDLALVARDEQRLSQLANKLRADYKNRVLVLPKDLSHPATPQEIFEALSREEFPVSTLINNAGFGVWGRFTETDWIRESELLQVNIAALVHLTKLFLKPMIERHQGDILNVASTAAFQPGPLASLYYASKAFVYSFSTALALELEGTGVNVTTLCPGGTDTEFHKRAGMEKTRLFRNPVIRPMSARAVAEAGLDGLHHYRKIVIPGWQNKVTVALSKRSPGLMAGKIAGRLNETVSR